MLTYRIDVVKALKEAGYNTTRIRKDKVLGEATLQSLREQKPISWAMLNKLCKLLKCQPGDIIEYTEGDYVDPHERDEKHKIRV